ncbi:MAG: uracil-DNA glycosylase, partial [Fibrobacterota bacterium]|nr:uracil-DNA glycosylase [Fibrobacterota bacterium]
MGTEEVILPHPRVRKAAGAASGDSRATFTGHPQSMAAHLDSIPALSIPGSSKIAGLSPEGGLPAIHDYRSQETIAADLFQSLTQALAGTSDLKRSEAAATARASIPRGVETSNLPVFMGLPDFWEYMEKHSYLLLGESGGSTLARVIRGRGPVKAPLALVGFEPGEADAAEGKPFSAEAGALLEKMMRAIRIEMPDLYLTNLIKSRLPGKVWSRRELVRIVPLLHIELGLAQPHMVLLLGQECAQSVLKTGKGVEELRQETHRLDGREFFVTYHPQELLRKEELKRKAWEDLQWLQRRMAEAQART